MAAPVLRAPGHFLVLSAGKLHAHKIPPFRGAAWGFLKGGGGSAKFIFMGVGIFPIQIAAILRFGHLRPSFFRNKGQGTPTQGKQHVFT